MVDRTFPPRYRVRKAAEYRAIFENGRKLRAGPILGYLRPNGLPHSRLGMAVSRKVGGAPRRNRIKRLFREAFRLIREELPTGYDVVLIPIDRNRKYALDDVQKRLRNLFSRIPPTTQPPRNG